MFARGQLLIAEEQEEKWISPCPRSRPRKWSREAASAVHSALTCYFSISSRLNQVLIHETVNRHWVSLDYIYIRSPNFYFFIFLLISHIISWCQKSSPWSQGRKNTIRKERTYDILSIQRESGGNDTKNTRKKRLLCTDDVHRCRESAGTVLSSRYYDQLQ